MKNLRDMQILRYIPCGNTVQYQINNRDSPKNDPSERCKQTPKSSKQIGFKTLFSSGDEYKIKLDFMLLLYLYCYRITNFHLISAAYSEVHPLSGQPC